jgi:hypothetical protein
MMPTWLLRYDRMYLSVITFVYGICGRGHYRVRMNWLAYQCNARSNHLGTSEVGEAWQRWSSPCSWTSGSPRTYTLLPIFLLTISHSTMSYWVLTYLKSAGQAASPLLAWLLEMLLAQRSSSVAWHLLVHGQSNRIHEHLPRVYLVAQVQNVATAAPAHASHSICCNVIFVAGAKSRYWMQKPSPKSYSSGRNSPGWYCIFRMLYSHKKW